MKRVNFKAVLMTLVVAFTFLMLGTERANAQSVSSTLTNTAVYTVPTGNFVSSDQAQTLIQSELSSLKDLLLGMTPGSPAYNATMAKYNYFAAIDAYIKSGNFTVAQAISKAMERASYPKGAVSTAVLNQWKQEAVNLLS